MNAGLWGEPGGRGEGKDYRIGWGEGVWRGETIMVLYGYNGYINGYGHSLDK
jgi:hypothetical protein